MVHEYNNYIPDFKVLLILFQRVRMRPKYKDHLKQTVSATDFYIYRIMERDGEECYLLLFRNLLNHFLVDMYAKIDTGMLSFIRNIFFS